MSKGWTKSAWRAKPRVQMPDYPDQAALNTVEAQLAKYPPLVFAGEARRLKKSLALAGEGKAFLLQGGQNSTVCGVEFRLHGDIFLNYATSPNFLSIISVSVTQISKHRR